MIRDESKGGGIFFQDEGLLANNSYQKEKFLGGVIKLLVDC